SQHRGHGDPGQERGAKEQDEGEGQPGRWVPRGDIDVGNGMDVAQPVEKHEPCKIGDGDLNMAAGERARDGESRSKRKSTARLNDPVLLSDTTSGTIPAKARLGTRRLQRLGREASGLQRTFEHTRTP